MKKTNTFIILIILSLTTFSQDYYPLIEEEKTWNVMTVVPSGDWPPFDTTYYTVNYFVTGDSTLNNIEYKKIYTSDEEMPTYWTLNGLIREDSTKKVWYKSNAYDYEVLLYDFSLAPGDSLKLGFDTTFYYLVDSITTEIIDGSQRDKYWISQDDYYWHETWIEGIGSNKGIINGVMATAVGGWTWLLCMSEDGELIYMNPNYESCYLITGINKIDKPIIQIYPNPAKKLLRIENITNIEIESISITNINGQIIKQFDSRKNQLDISGISSGFYFLKVSYKNGELTEKIIIE